MLAEQWSGRTVVVTGGRGFIGAHFTAELAAAGAKVISLHRAGQAAPAPDGVQEIELDLLSTLEVDALFRYVGAHADTLVHCAGIDGNADFKKRNFGSILDSNVRITSNVLNGARDHGIGTVVLLSSAEIYSASSAGLVTEEDDYRKLMELSGDGYTLAKVFAELLADAYRQQFGMRVFLARPTNVYGPGDGLNPRSRRVIPAMLARIAAGEPVQIWGDGQQRRSFIHVHDLVHAVLEMVGDGSYDTFNVATRSSVSLLELARLLFAEFEVAERIELDTTKAGGAKARELSADKMYEVIGFTPRPLADGLRDTVHWYKSTLAH
ncbi:NAD-dependent epimerase/dehydratase family protein [Amycolatopsis magusensis]|uniref:dTDP-4-dehydro-6-deoxy-alpha-D-gulose 4-ketoreductase n=1 Tax=Amycolatopsis magusensis TaxID=882444 RepID=A0ABS4PNL3_9PSEU|nr:NAD-dependent epimerase/dehydratase family protein [Amycolatopsis magusensis]MBP2180443.1 dTDP-4-dehydro-6-deoxy-alpha-D-gulose 4-ketoreductase [Amycolatopsis magusensis]MDI5976846.1 NAD-dependent epimerase/dehydratase family protein [Amycolatopsis magusensis]